MMPYLASGAALRLHRAPPAAQSYVEVFVQLPPGAEPRTVRVELDTHALSVYIGDERVFEGPLFAPVKAEESVWLISASAAAAPALVSLLRGAASLTRAPRVIAVAQRMACLRSSC